MEILRRFLVWQSLLVWQGGFFFYAAVVVPTGTDLFGPFGQGTVTREVTLWLNRIGLLALVFLMWDQWAVKPCRFGRVALWAGLLASLIILWVVHPVVDRYVDIEEGYTREFPTFYFWHRVYVWTSTVQWVLSLAYGLLTLRAWSLRDRSA